MLVDTISVSASIYLQGDVPGFLTLGVSSDPQGLFLRGSMNYLDLLFESGSGFSRPRFRRKRGTIATPLDYSRGFRRPTGFEDFMDDMRLAPPGRMYQALVAAASVDGRRWTPNKPVSNGANLSGLPYFLGDTSETPRATFVPGFPLRPPQDPRREIAPWKIDKGVPVHFPQQQAELGKGRVRFENPLRVVICLKRRIRRRVMFALNLWAKGSRAKHRRRGFFSDVVC